MAAYRGSCICGEVVFEVDGPFDRFLNCHCSRCRKATGTAHSCEVIVKASAVLGLAARGRGTALPARTGLAARLRSMETLSSLMERPGVGPYQLMQASVE